MISVTVTDNVSITSTSRRDGPDVEGFVLLSQTLCFLPSHNYYCYLSMSKTTCNTKDAFEKRLQPFSHTEIVHWHHNRDPNGSVNVQ